MGKTIDVGLGNIGAINALNGKISDAVNISDANNEGVVSVQFTFSTAITTAGGKWTLQHSIDGVVYDSVRSDTGAVIEVTFPLVAITAAYIANFSNLHTTYIRILGTGSGTNGVISGIKIIAK